MDSVSFSFSDDGSGPNDVLCGRRAFLDSLTALLQLVAEQMGGRCTTKKETVEGLMVVARTLRFDVRKGTPIPVSVCNTEVGCFTSDLAYYDKTGTACVLINVYEYSSEVKTGYAAAHAALVGRHTASVNVLLDWQTWHKAS